jgi:hypothetical protein
MRSTHGRFQLLRCHPSLAFRRLALAGRDADALDEFWIFAATL